MEDRMTYWKCGNCKGTGIDNIGADCHKCAGTGNAVSPKIHQQEVARRQELRRKRLSR